MIETTVTIVGGGVHGVHVACRLLESGLVGREHLRIVEPDGLLGGFRRKCRQCGISELRSPFVHHVANDPFSLRDFARETDRTDELVASNVGADRPTVSLFFDHADRICRRFDLESLVIEGAATAIRDAGDRVEVETTAGNLTAHWCLLAVGHDRSYAVPTWVRALPSTAPVTHVWDPTFDPDAVDETAAVGIVGGGITAGQLATSLTQPGREVTLFARSPFQIESLEAPTDWMHATRVVEKLHALAPASRARSQLIEQARHDGAMPPYVFRRLRRALEADTVALERAEIEVATSAGGTVVVTCHDGTAVCLDHLVCATGFETAAKGPLFRKLRHSTNLQTGYRGMPVLEDETLQWRRADGTASRVLVTGAAAEHVLGPFARNIIGARRAGTRIHSFLVSELEGEPRSKQTNRYSVASSD